MLVILFGLAYARASHDARHGAIAGVCLFSLSRSFYICRPGESRDPLRSRQCSSSICSQASHGEPCTPGSPPISYNEFGNTRAKPFPGLYRPMAWIGSCGLKHMSCGSPQSAGKSRSRNGGGFGKFSRSNPTIRSGLIFFTPCRPEWWLGGSRLSPGRLSEDRMPHSVEMVTVAGCTIRLFRSTPKGAGAQPLVFLHGA